MGGYLRFLKLRNENLDNNIVWVGISTLALLQQERGIKRRLVNLWDMQRQDKLE